MKHILWLSVCLGGLGFADSPAQKLAFQRAYEVLETHCFECHNADKAKGELVMESLEGLLEGGKSGPAIVQGHADQSPLITRVNLGDGSRKRMPKKNDPLSAADKIILSQWIDDGALWFEEVLGEDPEMMNMAEMHADLGVAIGEVSAEDAAFFKQHIESLFDSHCTGCHGGQKQKGGLRLDSRTMALRGGDTGPLVVPGDPEKSELYFRLTLSADDDDLMPPPEKPRISSERIAKVEEWIKRGAPWPKPKSKLDRGGENHFTTFFGTLSAAEQQAVDALKDAGVFLEPLGWEGGGLRVVASFAPKFDYEQTKALASFADHIYWADFTRVTWNAHSQKLLKQLPHLVILHVERSAFDDAALAALPELPRLDYLNLHSTQISDASLAKLEKFPRLTKLYLWNTRVTPAAVKGLAKQRPELKIVR